MWKWLPVVAILSIAGANEAPAAKDRSFNKIVGGVEATRGEFPFMVSLQSGTSHFCGGSLIAPNWVLTAAHCAEAVSASRIRIKTGLHRRTDTTGVETFTAAQVIVHPSYNNGDVDSDYDFALIKLSGNSAFAPIALNEAEMNIPDAEEAAPISTTLGWGVTSENGSLSQPLMKVDVPLVSPANCEIAYPNGISDRMICAGLQRGGRDSCQGDSGGPLVTRTEAGAMHLLGVVSWGEGCARPRKYGVYAKVNSVIGWIRDNAVAAPLAN